jgi:hypothetical protein
MCARSLAKLEAVAAVSCEMDEHVGSGCGQEMSSTHSEEGGVDNICHSRRVVQRRAVKPENLLRNGVRCPETARAGMAAQPEAP